MRVSLARRQSFTLYVVLLLSAHRGSGRVLVMKEALASLLSATMAEIDEWLSELEAARFIRVLSRGTYLALAVENWPSGASKPNARLIENPSKTEGKIPPSIPPPGFALLCPAQKFSLRNSARRALQSKAEAKQEQGDGVEGVGGGEEAARERFLEGLAQLLGPTSDAEALRTFCRSYPREILETALDRAMKTPLSKIKKSRGALFVHLVKTYANPKPHP